jgi:hypothetical protein
MPMKQMRRTTLCTATRTTVQGRWEVLLGETSPFTTKSICLIHPHEPHPTDPDNRTNGHGVITTPHRP